MSACCSTFECAADQQFNEKKAAEELKRYRTKGPGPTTRLLQQGLEHGGCLNGTLLDIGSGIGLLTLSDALAALRRRLADGGRLVVFITKRNWLTRLMIGWRWRSTFTARVNCSANSNALAFRM